MTFSLRLLPLAVVLLFACEAKTGEPGHAPASSGPVLPVAGKDYRIELSAPKEMSVGVASDCVLTITPAPPWALKAETPFSVTLAPGPGLSVSKTHLDAKDFVNPKTPAKSVHTACVAAQSGARTLSATLSFFLCSDEICRRMTDKLTATVKVD
jgi:hypothetical protein